MRVRQLEQLCTIITQILAYIYFKTCFCCRPGSSCVKVTKPFLLLGYRWSTMFEVSTQMERNPQQEKIWYQRKSVCHCSGWCWKVHLHWTLDVTMLCATDKSSASAGVAPKVLLTEVHSRHEIPCYCPWDAFHVQTWSEVCSAVLQDLCIGHRRTNSQIWMQPLLITVWYRWRQLKLDRRLVGWGERVL